MSTFKKAKVIMLPTNKPSKLGNLATYQGKSLAKVIKEGVNLKNTTVQFWNLYIISDDEIKLFDWVYNNKENIVEQITSKTQLIFVLEENKENQTFKKIIATTDILLKIEINGNRGNLLPDVSFDINLPQPSQQFIEKYIEEYNKGNVITDILVEYEEGRSYSGNKGLIIKEWLKINPKDNTITIKKLKDSYSREEVIKLLESMPNFFNNSISKQIELRTKWIKENL